MSRCFLAAISAIFFLIRSENRVPCQREAKKRLPVKVHRWRNQNLWYPAKRRPLNLVSRSPWTENNSSQNLVYLVIPGNGDERKGLEIASGNSFHNASKSVVGYSQVSRQENAQNSRGKLVHGATSKTT